MVRLYLDTQQWNYLVEHVDHSDRDIAATRKALDREVRAKNIELVTSVPVLQEVVGTHRQRPDKYRALVDILFRSVGHRWLKPLNERYVAEAEADGPLEPAQRYLSRDSRRKLRALSSVPSDIESAADETHAQIQRFKMDQNRLRPKVRDRLVEATGRQDIHGVLRDWWERRDVDDWVQDVVEEDVRRRLLNRPLGGTRATVPSAWLFVAFKTARIALNVGENRAIKASDYLDAEHVACGFYFDVLVTDDKALRETCVLLGADLPFDIEGFRDLLVRLR